MRRRCRETDKAIFESELDAQIALLLARSAIRNEDQKRERVLCSSYRCEHCTFWHLTGKQPDHKFRRGLGDAIRHQ